jgi:hypothetical protein
MDQLVEIVGWAGMAALLFAYARRQALTATVYALTNLVGALSVAAVCLARSTWPALALELAWAAIALRDLWRTRMAPPPASAR